MAKKYIDADLAQEKLKELCKKYNINFDERQRNIFGGDLANLIGDMPAADVQEVRHGRNVTYMNPVDEFVCSVCGFTSRDMSGYDAEEDVYYEFNPYYCPYCGRKMDGDTNGK